MERKIGVYICHCGSNIAATVDTQAVAQFAQGLGVQIGLEPVNRYETYLVNTCEQALRLKKMIGLANVKVHLDTYHMNIEEVSIPAALREAGPLVGHLHFADSNRGPVGTGHTDMTPVVGALRDIGFRGCASAEAFPWPDPDAAAAQTMKAYRKLFA
jgi:sugar phosphate isomerase/epimerase